MSLTALHDKFVAIGARMIERSGVQTPAAFGDPSSELASLRHQAGVHALDWQGKLVLTGEDRVRWLNGMVTNNVRDLAPGFGNYSFVLNPQGRIQGDLNAYNRGDHILITTDRAQLPKLKELFDKYIIMDDVEVTDVSDKLLSLVATGPTAHEILARADFQLPPLAPGQIFDTEWNTVGLSIVRGVLDRIQTYEIWLHPDNAAAVWDALLSAAATPVGTEALEWFRILNGVPQYGVDIGERDLPQETAQDHALHFVKGCYIGQEIVERIRSRGQVHRTLTGFQLSGEPLPARGTKVQRDGKDVGEITSAASIPIDGHVRNVALGYIRREAASPGTEIQVGGVIATVAQVPFKF
jgi:folate-binding protein YgfZ